MIAVIDHLTCHTAVNADILARNKTCHIGIEIEHHRLILRIANSACRLLHSICPLIYSIVIIDPTGRDGIDPRTACYHGNSVFEIEHVI